MLEGHASLDILSRAPPGQAERNIWQRAVRTGKTNLKSRKLPHKQTLAAKHYRGPVHQQH